MATTYTIDTAATIERLKEAEFSPDQSRAIVDLFAESHETLATKNDIQALQSDLQAIRSEFQMKIDGAEERFNAKIDKAEWRYRFWLIATQLAIASLVVLVLKFLP